MPTPTYDLLASTTLATATSSVTFSSIDQSYGDLILVINFTAGSGSLFASVEVNSDTGTNYPFVKMVGNGSSATSVASMTEYFSMTPGVSAFEQSFLGILQIMDYSATDKHKSGLIRTALSGEATIAVAQRWANTNAINQLRVFTFSGPYPVGSTFNLYGVAK
jgi:uncharacterized protein YraI